MGIAAGSSGVGTEQGDGEGGASLGRAQQWLGTRRLAAERRGDQRRRRRRWELGLGIGWTCSDTMLDFDRRVLLFITVQLRHY